MSHVTWKLLHATRVVHSSIFIVWRDSFMCDVPRSYVWRDSFICVMWLIHTCYLSLAIIFRSVCHASICIAWRDSFMCDVTYASIWRGSWICTSWLIHSCGSCRTTASLIPHAWTSHSAHADMIYLYDSSTYDSSTYDSTSIIHLLHM